MPGLIFSTPSGVNDNNNGSQRIMSVGSAVTVVEAPRVIYCEPTPLNSLSVGLVHLCAQTAVSSFVGSIGKILRRFQSKDREILLADEISGDIINRNYFVNASDNFYVGEFLTFDDHQWIVKRVDDNGYSGTSITVSKIPRDCDHCRNPTYVELSDDCRKLGKVLPSNSTNTVVVQRDLPVDIEMNSNLNFVRSISPRIIGFCLGHKAVKAVESRSKIRMLRIGASEKGGVYVACRAKRLARISSSFDPTLVVQDVEFREIPSQPNKVELIKCEGTTRVSRPPGSVYHLSSIGNMCVLVVTAFVFVKLAAFRGSTTAHDLRGLSFKTKIRYFLNPLNWF